MLRESQERYVSVGTGCHFSSVNGWNASLECELPDDLIYWLKATLELSKKLFLPTDPELIVPRVRWMAQLAAILMGMGGEWTRPDSHTATKGDWHHNALLEAVDQLRDAVADVDEAGRCALVKLQPLRTVFGVATRNREERKRREGLA